MAVSDIGGALKNTASRELAVMEVLTMEVVVDGYVPRYFCRRRLKHRPISMGVGGNHF